MVNHSKNGRALVNLKLGQKIYSFAQPNHTLNMVYKTHVKRTLINHDTLQIISLLLEREMQGGILKVSACNFTIGTHYITSTQPNP